MTQVTPRNMERARLIVGAMLNEHFYDFAAERSNDFINHSDRAARCYDAAENGGDGSTHQESINDMRAYWDHCVRWNRRGHEFPERVDAAVSAYFDEMELRFEADGTLFQEVG